MPLNSMTGFARADGVLDRTSWTWEVRSVNGRSLDVRVRLAPGHDALEPRVREACAKRFQRGNIQVGLTVKRVGGETEIRLNEAALRQVLEISRRSAEIAKVSPPKLDYLLGIRGILETAEPEETPEAGAARLAAMQGSLDQALDGLAAARAAEGRRLQAVLTEQLDRIALNTQIAAASPARTPEAIGKRLGEQVQRLLRDATPLDPTRLHQEAALLAARADIEEEIQRLGSHLTAARALLEQDAAAGRQLDFLAQEFNREANTLCSKANDAEITRAGLALKVVIDQMREQVQNIE
jgi:uncharacterized protein (TIGR00255 family)